MASPNMKSAPLADDVLREADAIGGFIEVNPRRAFDLLEKGCLLPARKANLDFAPIVACGALQPPRCGGAAMRVLGIDPDAHGASAVVDSAGNLLDVFDMQ